ncbi:MAG: hypothetical protein RLZZ501_623, partial [Pseudomonadota bacterium]
MIGAPLLEDCILSRRGSILAGAAVLALAVLSAPPPAARAAEPAPLVIGGGEVTGYYFPVAGALCRVINKDHPRGMSCTVMPSSGSAANLAALKAGEVDL